MRKNKKINTPPEPWKRQPGESEKAYAAFEIYLNMGNKRTIVAVVKKCKKSRSLIDRWKGKYSWEERARAHDNDLQEKAHKKKIQEREEMIERYAKYAKDISKKVYDALMKIPEGEFKPQDVARLLDTASKLEFLSRGEVTERTEGKQIIAGDVSLNQIDLSKITDKELAELDVIAEKISAKSE